MQGAQQENHASRGSHAEQQGTARELQSAAAPCTAAAAAHLLNCVATEFNICWSLLGASPWRRRAQPQRLLDNGSHQRQIGEVGLLNVTRWCNGMCICSRSSRSSTLTCVHTFRQPSGTAAHNGSRGTPQRMCQQQQQQQEKDRLSVFLMTAAIRGRLRKSACSMSRGCVGEQQQQQQQQHNRNALVLCCKRFRRVASIVSAQVAS
jgi:hypothetical protein